MNKLIRTKDKQIIFLLFVVFFAFGLVPHLSHADCEDDTQMEIVCSEETLDLQYGDHTSGCVISPTADADPFRFQGVAGDVVRFICSGLTLNLDCRIEVWEPSPAHVKIVDTSCYADQYHRCTASQEVELPSTGRYDLLISDADNNSVGSYVFNLENLPPHAAPNLPYDATLQCAVDPCSDVDKFKFCGTAGSTVRIIVTGLWLNLDSRIEVWDPEGTKVNDVWCTADQYHSCSVYTDIPITISGLHSIGVSDFGNDNSAGYSIQLICLFGDCACTPRPEDCSNGVDDDFDGKTDCADPDCADDYACIANAEASTYGSASLSGSGAINEVILFLIPVGLILLLTVLRRTNH